MINTIINLITLNIDKAVEIGIKNNIQILQAQKENEKLISDLIKARSQLLPQVSINSIYTYTANPAVIKFGAPTKYIGYPDPNNPNQFIIYPDPNSIVYSEIPFRPSNSYNLQLTIRQSIFSWFREINAIKLAEQQLKIQSDIISLNQHRLANQIKSFYLDILFFKETFIIYEKTLQDLELVYNTTKKRFENGLASDIELMQAKVNYENARFNYENAKKTYIDLLNNLKTILNIPSNEEIVIEDNIDIVKIDTNIVIDETKIKRRKDLLVLEEQMKNLQRLAEIQNSLNKPNIFGQIQYVASIPSPSLENKLGGTWTFSIIFNWNVFDGFSNSAEVRKINEQINELKFIYDFQVQSSQNQLKSAIENLNISRANLERTKENAQLSEKLLNSAKAQFENGLISNLQFFEIQRSYIASQISYKQALKDHYKAILDLDLILNAGKTQ